jgi:hypothetical protein
MFFLLQKEDKYNGYSIDVLILKNILDREKYLHEYIPFSLDDFYDENKKLMKKESYNDKFERAIPVGTIDFVTAWLNIFKGIDKINPIEVPPCLRTDEFLKRKYSIVSKDNIPTQGEYFIKDASQLKVFSYSGRLESFLVDDLWQKPVNEFDTSLRLNPNHLYQVSEVVNILSEYRVYIISGEIEAIAHYNGDPCVFPDVNLIQKANNIYYIQRDYPTSYSMDIMITNRGTSICEIHPYTSIGHYNLLNGSNLAYAYRDGMDYIIKHNTKPTEFSNFNTFNYKD